MKPVVFLGPSLELRAAEPELDAIYLPPAAQGDLLRAAERGPPAIGLIDGFFHSVPSVWHKEVLWAMSRGIHVFGASSMGALRAAELEAFGMEGIGTIYEKFRTRALEDDDEVTVAHGPKEFGFRAVSEAMVDIRATLDHAERAGVLSSATRDSLVRIAKQLYYPTRTYLEIVDKGLEAGLPSKELAGLQEWLPLGRLSHKREDALLLLRTMRTRLQAGLAPKKIRFTLQRTEFFEHSLNDAGSAGSNGHGTELDPVPALRLVEELKVSGNSYRIAQRAAVSRTILLREARTLGARLTPSVRTLVDHAIRERFCLTSEPLFEQWLVRNDLTREQYDRLVDDEASLRWVDDVGSAWGPQGLADALRLSGEYPDLASRVRAKVLRLREMGVREVDLDSLPLSKAQLMEWYFANILQRSPPSYLGDYARSVGFSTEDEMVRAIARQYLCSLPNLGSPTTGNSE